MIGNLDRPGTRTIWAFVCPGPPDLDPGDLREAIERLTPHVQRAARISRRIGEADMRAAAATDVLDNSPYCVMALGPDLELLLANAQAQALLEQEDGFALLRRPDQGERPCHRATIAGYGGGAERRSFLHLLGQPAKRRATAAAFGACDQPGATRPVREPRQARHAH